MMRPSLDTLLSHSYPPDAAALGRGLGAARAELARSRSVHRWRTQAVWVFTSTVAMVGLVAVVVLVLKQTTLAALLGRAPLFGLAWLSGAVCAWGALSPRGHRLRLLVLALWTAAFRPLRALVAGLSVGTTGALVGAPACAQGWLHVAGYHLSAWVLIAVVELMVSRTLKPRSFAP